MSQTETDPSQTKSPPESPDDDPLAHLHKMSTTAGLGSGDYVAVNGTAVFALLLGVASALALMTEVLLIIPLVCVIAAVVAWGQIRHSNGTQTGKGLVLVAMALGLGMGGFVLGRWATEDYRTREDRKAIQKVITEFGEKLKADDTAGAYQLFSDRFMGRVDQATFTNRLKALQDYFGKVASADWNGLVEFQADEATGGRFALTSILLKLEKQQLKDTAVLHKSGDRWQLEAMNEIFPPPPPPGGQGRGGPPR